MHKPQHLNSNIDSNNKGKISQQQDFFPCKTTRNNQKINGEQNENCLSLNEEDRQRLFSINSPMSSMRFGDEQRKILLDGKRILDNFAYKFSEDDSEFIKFDMQDGDKTKKSFINLNATNNGGIQNVGIMELSNIEEMQSQGVIQYQDTTKHNRTLDLTNKSLKMNSQNVDQRKKSLFIENLGAEFSKYDEGKSFKSSDQVSQYDLNQMSISPSKFQNNNQRYIAQISAQNSYTQSLVRSNKNNNADLSIMLNPYNTQRDSNTMKKDTTKTEDYNKMGFKGVWREKSLLIIYYARKFLVDAKKYSTSWRFKNLSLNQFQAINDISCDEKSFVNRWKTPQRKGLLAQCFSFICKNQKFKQYLKENFVVIRPDSHFKLLWDIILLMLLFLNIFYIPVQICFIGDHQLKLNYPLQVFLSDIPGWSFLADAVIRANTAFYQKGQLITQKQKILMRYYKENFFLDLIIIIPFIISQKLSVPFLGVIFLLRIYRLINITSNFEQLLNLSQKRSAIFSLVKLAVTMMFVAHFCGCSFFYVGTLHMENNEINDPDIVSWVEKQNIFDKSFSEKYTTCLYWATITMITVGKLE